jgi:hypothetical protein
MVGDMERERVKRRLLECDAMALIVLPREATVGDNNARQSMYSCPVFLLHSGRCVHRMRHCHMRTFSIRSNGDLCQACRRIEYPIRWEFSFPHSSSAYPLHHQEHWRATLQPAHISSTMQCTASPFTSKNKVESQIQHFGVSVTPNTTLPGPLHDSGQSVFAFHSDRD